MDVVKSLGGALGRLGGVAVYVEALPQGVKTPCFFLREVERSCVRTVGERYKERVEVEITYYPKDKLNARGECRGVESALFEYLEFVETEEGLIRGIDKRSEIKEGVLRFKAAFEFFRVVKKEEEKMGVLEYNRS